MQDTNNQLSPTTFVKEIETALPGLTQIEASRLLEHGCAWAVSFYNGVVPQPLVDELEILEARCQSLRM